MSRNVPVINNVPSHASLSDLRLGRSALSARGSSIYRGDYLYSKQNACLRSYSVIRTNEGTNEVERRLSRSEIPSGPLRLQSPPLEGPGGPYEGPSGPGIMNETAQSRFDVPRARTMRSERSLEALQTRGSMEPREKFVWSFFERHNKNAPVPPPSPPSATTRAHPSPSTLLRPALSPLHAGCCVTGSDISCGIPTHRDGRNNGRRARARARVRARASSAEER